MRSGPLEIALLLMIALAGCRGGEAGGNGAAAGGPGQGGPAAGGAPVQTDTLTGLYEGGEGPRRNQLCMIERDGQRTSFGFVTWSGGDANCSGSGLATRDGDRLRLQLDGDESCTLEARVEGRRVTLPSSVPAACKTYYCGAGAEMAGAAFDKVGGAQADALRAVDLVGEALCGG
ncbi:MAG TPA: hypothetical protein VGB54_06295 [Allosphingosinicella sp.]|jgi:hypothetical protein